MMNPIDARNSRESRGSSLSPAGRMCAFHEARRLTGIEPSRIRFIETEFADFFQGTGDGMQSASFDEKGITLLRTIHRLIFEEGKSPFAVREEISRGKRKLRTIAVTSGKGGVGKTTVSLNLAITMASRGLRTLLLDADMGLGNVHVFAGIAPRGSLLDLVEGRTAAADLLSTGPGNIQVLCGNSGSTGMADLPPHAIEQLGRSLARLGEDFDVMIIDTGAGISAQVTRFLAMADDIVVVTTPNIAATLDAYGVIKVAREEAMRGKVHLLVNQADDESEFDAVYEKIRMCSERFLQYSPASLGGMMRDAAVEQSNQSRRPLVLCRPEHQNSELLTQIAADLCASMASATPAGATSKNERIPLESPAPV